MRYQVSWTKDQRKGAEKRKQGLVALAFETSNGDRMEMTGPADDLLIAEVQVLLLKWAAQDRAECEAAVSTPEPEGGT